MVYPPLSIHGISSLKYSWYIYVKLTIKRCTWNNNISKQKFGRNGLKNLEALIKNPATFISQEFRPLTATKIIMEKY